ncbi:MAG: metalloregulator ArsR/SmtB family transcription factor, partial [Actinocatenispora sp.]
VLISSEIDVIRVLADPLRARMVELLADGALCTCHLVAETGAKQPLISHHLRALRDAGLVEREPHGRYTYYRLVPDALTEVTAHLSALAERASNSAGLRREC